ncbi:hypothetical protein HZB78_03400 [Candidatus Collierbacteria bacterium]|nr:hypothetical protein [Candidatus Collierbacteria bacterium]
MKSLNILKGLAFASIMGVSTILPLITPQVVLARDSKLAMSGDLKKHIVKTIIGKRSIVRGGIVTAKNDSSLTVSKDDKSYDVEIDSDTKLMRRFGGESSLSELNVNDKVNVSGTWDSDDKTKVKAKLIRNLSVMKRNAVLSGTVQEVSDNGFKLETAKRGTEEVSVSSDTNFINQKGEGISKSDVQTGHKIRVKGVWNKENHKEDEVSQVKDFSLPEKSGK